MQLAIHRLMKRKTIPLLTGALALANAHAATIIINNSDFEDPGIVAGSNTQTVTGWSGDSTQEYIANPSGDWGPVDITQVGYFTGAADGIFQELNHNWSTTDKYTLTFDAYEAGWRTGTAGDTIQFQLRQTDGTLLWDSGQLNLDNTLTGTQGSITYGATSHAFSFNIDAATDFVGGSSGEQIRIDIVANGDPVWFDNISLTSVPEPSTSALVGLVGLGFILRRSRS